MLGKLRGSQRVPLRALVSLLLGAVGFLSSQVVDQGGGNQKIMVGLAVSLFLGGLAFVSQSLYEVEKRLEATESAYSNHADGTQRELKDGFKKINDATELFSLVESSALSTESMIEFVRNAARVRKEPPLVFDFAMAEIGRLSTTLKTLAEGADVTYEGEDRDMMLGLTKAAKKSIDAISMTTVDAGGHSFVDGGLWSSDLGQRYLDAQRDAIKRGVLIRRIFIIEESQLKNDETFRSVFAYHQEIGIDVRVLIPSRIPMPRRNTLVDFIVFDDALSYQATPASHVGGQQQQPVIVNTQLVVRPEPVIGKILCFQELWQAAADSV